MNNERDYPRGGIAKEKDALRMKSLDLKDRKDPKESKAASAD